jgi:diguanylate cyclase (GGDEF)-like protein
MVSSHTLLFILGGCLLGAIQLMVGMTIGIWVRRGSSADSRSGQQDMIQVSLIAKRLQKLADEMSSTLGEHCTRLDKASVLLTTSETKPNEVLAEMVVDVIGEIMRSNQNLKSKLETAEQRLQQQATQIESHISRALTDPLTGLPNRREFNERLEERMAAWNRRGEIFSLLLLDVDHFKKFNDEYGHLAGDQVLAAMGRALRGSIRRDDMVARYGGEEFAVLLPGTTLEAATAVAKNVREAVSRLKIDFQGQQLAVTTSAGLATIQVSELPESLIHRADAALYAAKGAGRNCAYLHDGQDCHPAAPGQEADKKPTGGAADLVALINSPDAEKPAIDDASSQTNGFGNYLPREEISAEFAQTCEELRRFVEERDKPKHDASSTSQPA